MSKKSIFAMLAIVLVCGYAVAQTPTGKIVGKIVDDQGSPLPGVSVVATSPKLVGQAAAVSDDTGTYRLFALPSGMYTVLYTLQGFKSIKREDIQLELEHTLTLNITLEPSALAEEITVVGQSPLIDVKSTTKGTTIKKELFMTLPKGRNFQDLLSTMPGVQYETNTGGLSVDGATGTENMFYMDGTNINNVHLGTQAQSAVFEMVEEIKVTASGYNAEFGGSMGGVINVITRSGGNEFHGDLIGYYDDDSKLMLGKSRNYLRTNPQNDAVVEYVNNDDLFFQGGDNRDTRNRYEGVFNLGGYIFKDRLWFYGSFNPIISKRGADRFFLADPAGSDGKRPTSLYKRTETNYNAQVKLTAQPFKGLRLSGSWVNNFYKYRGAFPAIEGSSNKAYEWAKDGFNYPNMSAAFAADYSASNSLLFSLRGGYFMQDQNNQQIAMPTTRWYFNRNNNIYKDIPADLIRARNWTNWAGETREYKKFLYERLSANFDVTYYMNLAGEHAWKAGFQFVRLAENVDRSAQHPLVGLNWGIGYYGLATGLPVMGRYGYTDIRGSWTSPYGWNWKIHSNNFAFYLQDSWTIGNRLTVNLGLRTEQEYIPSFATNEPSLKDIKPIQFDFADKLAPRLGAIYDVFGDSSLKVFGSFGIYYDVMKLYMAEGAFGGFKWVTDYYELNNYDWTKIAASGKVDDRASQEAGGKYVGSMNWRLPSFDSTDPNMKPVSKSELSFGAEKKLTEELSFSARAVYKHLIRTIEDIGVLTPAGEFYYNANPGEGWSLPISKGGKFDDKFWECPKPNWNYWGINLSLEKRFSNNWQGGVNYTWSRTTGCYGGLSSTDEGGRNSPNVERYYDLWFLQYDLKGNPLDGPLPSDRPHYFKVFGSYAFPFGLTVGVVGTGRSGQPLTTTLNMNNVAVYPNNRFDAGERLPFQLWTDIYAEYNLRIAKKYTVNINLNIYNITNTKVAISKDQTLNRVGMDVSDDQILSKTFDYKSRLANYDPNPAYGKVTGYFGTWSTRLGFRFSF
jgi:hypothetical protein